jgi:SAM-dependent methyltransferase
LDSTPTHCKICGASGLREIPGFAALFRITSDCRPFRRGGELYVCMTCAAVQKAVTPRWLSEIEEIYGSYEPYFQAGGAEQRVFDSVTRALRPRSDVIVDRLIRLRLLPETGRALDVGCGTGVTLQSLSRALPGFRLSGHEISRRHERLVAAIPNFEALYSRPLAEIDESFELVTLIHSLEHFPAPSEVMLNLRRILNRRGVLLVQVSDTENNPFDLVIADHLLHFSPASLRQIVSASALTVGVMARDWVSKELTCVCGTELYPAAAGEPPPADPKTVYDRAKLQIAWLRHVIESARQAKERGSRFGIFGTSIAGTWIAAGLDMDFDFFVDEDKHRAGRPYLDKPVLEPAMIEPGSTIYLALTPAVAQSINRRLSSLPVKFVTPPTFESAIP